MLVITKGTEMARQRELSDNQYTMQLLYNSYVAYVFIALHSSF